MSIKLQKPTKAFVQQVAYFLWVSKGMPVGKEKELYKEAEKNIDFFLKTSEEKSISAKKNNTKKAVKKVSEKKVIKKAVKKAIKKVAIKKIVKKAVKKVAVKKIAKKAIKKVAVKKVVKKAIKKVAVKKIAKKAVKKTIKKVAIKKIVKKAVKKAIKKVAIKKIVKKKAIKKVVKREKLPNNIISLKKAKLARARAKKAFIKNSKTIRKVANSK